MILAAGVGERMRPLTDHTPKPLLSVAGKPLLEHHILRLRDAGFTELVINVSHLQEQILAFCGNGSRWGVDIVFSPEDTPLETAGGIQRALSLLGDAPFLVVNGDIWMDAPFAALRRHVCAPADLATLVFVANPPQHPAGDFMLDAHGRVRALAAGKTGVTYAGVGIYTRALFDGVAPGKLPLRPLLDDAIDRGLLGGLFHDGQWEDVGTPERLEALNARVTGG